MFGNVIAQYGMPLAQEAISTGLTSAFGSFAGNMISSALFSGISGAAIGSMSRRASDGGRRRLWRRLGMLSGRLQNFENQDEAFKSYVQEAVEGQLNEMDTTLQTGSTIAGGREQNQLAFAQRFGSDAAARDYLDRVQTMAVQTNYGYDEIVGYSKLLLNSYGAEETLGVLKTLSDASAGLNLDSSDVNMFISGLSRMRTTNKATQEYLNYFSERGVDVYEALSRSTGAVQEPDCRHGDAGRDRRRGGGAGDSGVHQRNLRRVERQAGRNLRRDGGQPGRRSG